MFGETKQSVSEVSEEASNKIREQRLHNLRHYHAGEAPITLGQMEFGRLRTSDTNSGVTIWLVPREGIEPQCINLSLCIYDGIV